MKKSLTNIQAYTPEHDQIMRLELEIVKNAYNENKKNWLPSYSIKIPNTLTDMKICELYDSDQPMYNNKIEDLLSKFEVMYDKALADYPRYDNTVRIFFKSKEKAKVALYYIKNVEVSK